MRLPLMFSNGYRWMCVDVNREKWASTGPKWGQGRGQGDRAFIIGKGPVAQMDRALVS